MLLMLEEQDDRRIWVVVELHRPKGRVRSRIVLHLGEYRDREAAEADFRRRIGTDSRLRAIVDRWAIAAESVLSDRKSRARFLLFGVDTGGIAAFADEILRRREREEQAARDRARAAFWTSGAPVAAFRTLDLPTTAGLVEIKAVYRRRAFRLHPDLGGDHGSMVALNAAYEEASAYADWRGGGS